MTLAEAPYSLRLKITALRHAPDTSLLSFLDELGLGLNEEVIKLHSAPLGDPVALSVQGQVFTLRREVLELIEVEPCRP